MATPVCFCALRRPRQLERDIRPIGEGEREWARGVGLGYLSAARIPSEAGDVGRIETKVASPASAALPRPSLVRADENQHRLSTRAAIAASITR